MARAHRIWYFQYDVCGFIKCKVLAAFTVKRDAVSWYKENKSKVLYKIEA